MMQLNRNHLVALVSSGLGAAAILAASPALGATYQVGPGKAYASLDAVAPLLAAGDIVEVAGDATYAGGVVFKNSGTEANKITIRGVRVNGRRPALSGATSTVTFSGDHYVFEGFEVTGGSSRCVFHHANDITVRDAVVHDCAGHGILGADSDSGSLTLDYVEVYACGAGDTRHQIYIATDEETHLGSVFRMQHCYVHDGAGGNNVKSRAERNEIYYNWIEGAKYHELELIGPDGQDEGLAREDSDVVGNVIRKTGTWYATRVGGDGTGQTFGRYRFVNNTFLLTPGSSAAFRMFDGIESIEMSNNVFYRVGGGGVKIYVDGSASWATGRAVIAGAANWVPAGSESVPDGWRGTILGKDPGFADIGSYDLRPASGSELIDRGVPVTESPAGFPFPRPLARPEYLPPPRALEHPGAALRRQSVGAIDVGAYEFGQGTSAPSRGASGEQASTGGDAAPAGEESAPGAEAPPSLEAHDAGERGSCSYHGGAGGGPLGAALMAAAPLFAAALRRRGRARA